MGGPQPVRGKRRSTGRSDGSATQPDVRRPAFTQAMPRFDVLQRNDVVVSDADVSGSRQRDAEACGQHAGRRLRSDRRAAAGLGLGASAMSEYPTGVCFQATQAPATTNYRYHPKWPEPELGDRSDARMPLRFHPKLPNQNPNSVWTFDGTIPPKLVQGRYGEPILFSASQRAAGRRQTERRLRAPTRSRRTSTTATTGRRTTLHRRILLSEPVLRLPTGLSCSPGTTA